MIAFRMRRGGTVMAGAVLLVGLAPMDGHLVEGLLLGLLTLASLLLHELGHLLVAWASGVKVREIGLCLRGSYIQRERASTTIDECAIAFGGPLVNLLVAAALWGLPGVGHWLMIYNFILAISNLVPLPGTDGRRLLVGLSQTLARTRVPVAIVGDK
ncbi:MAG: site-2 protease family protein [Acidobacteriota bacterium]